MSFSNVGQVETIAGFTSNIQNKQQPDWVKSITLHHTSAPSLKQRPVGLTAKHIENMRDFYKSLGWSKGPHFFVDDDQIWSMTPVTERGIHAVSFNSTSLGIEVLGDYDNEDPKSGRGLACWTVAAVATKALLNWLNLPINANTIKFHREDPKTTKTCPGKKVDKDWFISMVHTAKLDIPAPAIVIPDNVFGVVDYVVKHKGYTYDEAVKLLKKEGPLYFFGNDWLEGAYYNTSSQRTVAPIKELEAIKLKCGC